LKRFPIIRVITKILIPYILLFGLYVQFHGDFGPGGGFQAGVIFASALILYGLVFGLGAVHKVAPPAVIEKLIALGLLIYAGTGVTCMLCGGNFLDYDVCSTTSCWTCQRQLIFCPAKSLITSSPKASISVSFWSNSALGLR
jgi:multisubunit Na+/H+ antiporter MnhB subunit